MLKKEEKNWNLRSSKTSTEAAKSLFNLEKSNLFTINNYMPNYIVFFSVKFLVAY